MTAPTPSKLDEAIARTITWLFGDKTAMGWNDARTLIAAAEALKELTDALDAEDEQYERVADAQTRERRTFAARDAARALVHGERDG